MRKKPPLVLFIIFAATSLGEGVFGVLLVAFVKLVLRADAIVYGSLLAVQAVRGLLGGLLIGQFGKRLVEDRYRGRVFGAMLSVGSLMTPLGMILAGASGDRVGPVLLLNIQGSVSFLSGLLVLVTPGRARDRAVVADKSVAREEASA